MDNAIDFSFYQQADEQQPQDELEQELELGLGNDSDLLRQFRRIFAPIVEDSLQLYYELNSQLDVAGEDDDDDAVQHIRIHRTVAELNELTSSEEETLMTQLQSAPEQPELELPSVDSSSTISTTSSSCLYAMHTPPPPCLESPQSEVCEPLTITEQVQLHAPPANNNNAPELDLEEQQDSSINNNNTSCSLSSTLTDSKTLDARTPIVV